MIESVDNYCLNKSPVLNEVEWKPIGIKECEGLYEVSSYGVVRSLHKKRDFYHKIMIPDITAYGYTLYKLRTKDKKTKKISGHRIVALTFIPNPNNLPEIDHINGDKLDNRIDNLRWVTHTENINNPITRERREIAMKKHRATADYKIERAIASKKARLKRSFPVVCIENGIWYINSYEAAKIYKIRPTNVWKSCYRSANNIRTVLTWRGKPVYHFRFATDEENAIYFPIYKNNLLREIGEIK